MTHYTNNQIKESKIEDASSPMCCTACGATSLTDIFKSSSLPVNVGLFWDSEGEARRAPTANITLAYCHNCSFVFNRIYDTSQIIFNPGYEVSLTHSAIFREFTSNVIDRLVDRFDLRNKKILEIGCGAGYFLRSICEKGGNQGIGIDPTVPSEGIEILGQGSVDFIRDYYNDKHTGIESDFVCCLSVFEDIPKPSDFLKTVRRMIGKRTDVPLYFEVFNAFRAIQQQETWSIHYEQCNYFSLDTLTALFQRCGFEVTDAGTCYQDGQYLYVEAIPGHLPQKNECNEEDWKSDSLPDEIAEFATNHKKRIEDWNRRLTDYQLDNQRVVVWGTGGKGISFLNTLDTKHKIEYAVEINPDKQGKFVPGSGQRIVSPEFLAQYNPDKVIITNALYQDEMQRQANQLGITPEFLIA